ncbi:hypothetical protein ABEB36_003524 [Hypothenemus hampei]|uniref:Serine/threonine-protein kinase receptor n=1 Tax=Hypothenemus hampei TaxID=57062 RepID=A0ABD1F9I2_HYPHA
MDSVQCTSCLFIFATILTFSVSFGAIHQKPNLKDTIEDDDYDDNLEETLPNDFLDMQTNIHLTTMKLYDCYSCDGADCTNPMICHNALQCWKSTVRETTGIVSFSRGCTIESDHVLFICNTPPYSGPQKRQATVQYRVDCCEGNYCNNGSFPELPPVYLKSPDDETNDIYFILNLITAVVVPFSVLALIGVACLYFLKRWHHNRLCKETRMDPEQYYVTEELIRATAAGDSTLREYLETTMSSGSGSGVPLLVQRTMTKQIALIDRIGKGRHGEVWRGTWQDENVAVKIFKSLDEASWTRETQVYSSMLLPHENILGYIGSDICSRNSYTDLWLITFYHPLGSLYDYLNYRTLSHSQLITMCFSILNGLVHLHTEIVGTCGKKPALAHRDLKTKNILVKNSGVCVIADFGMAVAHVQAAGTLDIGSNPRVGTKRYMPPEILDETIQMDNFDSFRRGDIYSLGLVLWEICRRVISNGIVEEYKPPFYDVVPSDPSFEDMKKVVCVDQQRPNIPNRWASDLVLSEMAKTMKECWHQNPMARLPALRVKKTIAKLAAIDNTINTNDLEMCV